MNSPETRSILVYVVYLLHITDNNLFFSPLANSDSFLLLVNPGRKCQEATGAYLDSLHQQHSLRVILVGFQDEVGQLVDDDIEWTLLLQRLAEVQLERERTATGQDACPKTETHPDNHLSHLVMVYLGNIVM